MDRVPTGLWPQSLRSLVALRVIAVRCVGLAYHVLLALAIRSAVRRSGREAAVAAGALAGMLAAGLLLIPYGWLLALAAMMASLGAADRSRWGLAGALGARGGHHSTRVPRGLPCGVCGRGHRR